MLVESRKTDVWIYLFRCNFGRKRRSVRAPRVRRGWRVRRTVRKVGRAVRKVARETKRVVKQVVTLPKCIVDNIVSRLSRSKEKAESEKNHLNQQLLQAQRERVCYITVILILRQNHNECGKSKCCYHFSYWWIFSRRNSFPVDAQTKHGQREMLPMFDSLTRQTESGSKGSLLALFHYLMKSHISCIFTSFIQPVSVPCIFCIFRWTLKEKEGSW